MRKNREGLRDIGARFKRMKQELRFKIDHRDLLESSTGQSSSDK